MIGFGSIRRGKDSSVAVPGVPLAALSHNPANHPNEQGLHVVNSSANFFIQSFRGHCHRCSGCQFVVVILLGPNVLELREETYLVHEEPSPQLHQFASAVLILDPQPLHISASSPAKNRR